LCIKLLNNGLIKMNGKDKTFFSGFQNIFWIFCDWLVKKSYLAEN